MALAYFGSKIQCQDARQRQEQRVHSAIGIIFGCEKRRQPARAPQPRKAQPSPWPRKVHLRTLWRSIASRCFDGNRSPPTVVGLEEYMRTLWTTAALGLMLTACKGEGGLEGLGIAEPAKVEQKQTEVMGKISRATSSEIQLENH